MTDDEYKKLKKRIEYSANKYAGGLVNAEDVAQEVLTTWLSRSKKSGQTVNQAVFSYLRKELGDKRSNNYTTKFNIRNAETIEGTEYYLRESEETDPIDKVCFDEAGKFLSGPDRAIILLKEMWGFTGSEIGYLFGVTESRINQRVKRIQERVQQNLSKESFACESRIREARERKKQQEISREVQKRSRVQSASQRNVQKVSKEKRQKMGARKIQEVPQKVRGAFYVDAF